MKVNSFEQVKNRKDYKRMQETLKRELLDHHFEMGEDSRVAQKERFASHHKEYFNKK